MDHNIIVADRYFQDQEASNMGACYHAAAKHGVEDQAEDCDNGNLSCPECPWRDK